MKTVAKLLAALLCAITAIAGLVAAVMYSGLREYVYTGIFMAKVVPVLGPLFFLGAAWIALVVLTAVAYIVGALVFMVLNRRWPSPRPGLLNALGVPLAAVLVAWALWHQASERLLAMWGVGTIPLLYMAAVAGAVLVAIIYAVGSLVQTSLVRLWPDTRRHALASSAVLAALLAAVWAVSRPSQETAAADAEFAMKCREAGTVFHGNAVIPVSSLAHDWDVRWSDGPHTRLELDERGRLRRASGILRPSLREKPDPDILVRHEVSDYDELLKRAPRDRRLMRYSATVLDRRSNEVLATMTYYVDFSRSRACGANEGNAIDMDAFIRHATAPAESGKSIHWKPY